MLKEEKGDVNKNFPFIIKENSFSLLFKTYNFRKILDLLRRKGIFCHLPIDASLPRRAWHSTFLLLPLAPFGKPWQSNLRKKRDCFVASLLATTTKRIGK